MEPRLRDYLQLGFSFAVAMFLLVVTTKVLNELVVLVSVVKEQHELMVVILGDIAKALLTLASK